MRNLVFFDLETKRTFAEVGGRENFRALGLAVAVTYSSASSVKSQRDPEGDPEGEGYSVYMEKDVDALIEELTSADLVVGFNLKRFDYEVLRGYRPLPPIPTLDILEEIYRELGFRVGLDALATSTLGVGKSAHGLQSVEWFREGKVDLVIEYCRQDVELTRLLYEYGRENGYLLYWDEGLQMNRRIAVSWR